MGFDLDEPGWQKNKGLRIVGAGHRLELPWPELASFPPYGAVRTRTDLDEILARHAAEGRRPAHGAHHVTGPVLDERTGRVVGVTAKPVDDRGRRVGDEVTYRAPVVVACDGVSARLAIALGIERRENRPMGVAVRAYYETPRHDDPWMESWLELWDGKPGREQPAARLRLDLRRRRRHGQRRARHPQHLARPSSSVDYKQILHALAGHDARGVGLPRREPGRPRSARPRCRWASTASRTTPAACCWSATPAAWSTRSTARASTTPSRPARWPPTTVIVQALARPDGPARERVLAGLRRGAGRGLRRLLHPRPRVRQDDRQPHVHEAGDASTACRGTTLMRFTAQADGQPDRPARRRRLGPHHQRAQQDRARRLTRAAPARTAHQPAAARRHEGRQDAWSSTPRCIALAACWPRDSRSSRSPSASLTGPKRYNRAKLDSYECGIEPTPQPVGGGRVPGEVLHHRDALHRLRHRDRLPLPVGRLLRRDAASSGSSRWSSSSPRCSWRTPTSGDAADWSGTDPWVSRRSSRAACC